MKHISIIILSTSMMLSNVAWADPVTQSPTNSLSGAALQINAKNAPAQPNVKAAKAYTNEAEKNNSLSRGALAKQEANMKTHASEKSSDSSTKSRPSHSSSFYGAVLEKQFSHFK